MMSETAIAIWTAHMNSSLLNSPANVLRTIAREVVPEPPEPKDDDPLALAAVWYERRGIHMYLLDLADQLETLANQLEEEL